MNKSSPILAALLLSLCWGVLAQAPPLIVDGDGDGVSDEIDDCPYTPPNTPVDSRGCPVASDEDGDGVPDSIDDCPYTPKGAQVDAHGCALDGDLDGVPDGIDLCPHTPYGERVDARGCEPGSVVLPPSTAKPPIAPAPVSPTTKPLPSPVPEKAGKPSLIETPAPAPELPVVPTELPPEPGAPELEKPVPPAAPEPVPLPPPAVPEPRVSAPNLPPNEAAKPQGSGPLIVETLGSVRFVRQSAELSKAEMERLQGIVGALLPRLAQLPGAGLYVTGYQQAGESSGLDQRRAELVRGYVIAKGLPAAQVRIAETVHAPRKDGSGLTVLLQLLPLQ